MNLSAVYLFCVFPLSPVSVLADAKSVKGKVSAGSINEVVIERQPPEIQSFEWTRKAAEQGNGKAQLMLAKMYESGTIETPKSASKALEWYSKAAVQGEVDAQLKLGDAYRGGLSGSLPKDINKAFEWTSKAAEQGDTSAMRILGRMCMVGDGLKRDDKKALEWYHKAAEQGDAEAQRDLGRLYEGRVVPKDLVLSHVWWSLYGAQGYEEAQKSLAAIGKQMTPKQIARAQELSRVYAARIDAAKAKKETEQSNK